uniref:Uncharacterized protein n=1 Tax=Anguilla anguilla TaxID=7936 RepID=A0A0E9VMN0_ANGAN
MKKINKSIERSQPLSAVKLPVPCASDRRITTESRSSSDWYYCKWKRYSL